MLTDIPKSCNFIEVTRKKLKKKQHARQVLSYYMSPLCAPVNQTAHALTVASTLAPLSSSSKLASVQIALNFYLPSASQLSHPKGMCLNAAPNQIA